MTGQRKTVPGAPFKEQKGVRGAPPAGTKVKVVMSKVVFSGLLIFEQLGVVLPHLLGEIFRALSQVLSKFPPPGGVLLVSFHQKFVNFSQL